VGWGEVSLSFFIQMSPSLSRTVFRKVEYPFCYAVRLGLRSIFDLQMRTSENILIIIVNDFLF